MRMTSLPILMRAPQLHEALPLHLYVMACTCKVNDNNNFGSFIAHVPVLDRSLRFTIKIIHK